jgi:hypothetical protein
MLYFVFEAQALRYRQRSQRTKPSPFPHFSPLATSMSRKKPVVRLRQELKLFPSGIAAMAALPPNATIPNNAALTRHDQRTLRRVPAICPPRCLPLAGAPAVPLTETP